MLLDKSLNFGLQNFFFVKSDETDGTYDYVAYMTKKGSILIARYPKDGSAALYCIKTGTFTTVWASKGTYDYVVPSTLIDPNIE
jgi:hypothetical protein